MTPSVSKFFSVVFLSLFALGVAAADKTQSIDQLLQLSGLNKQVSEVPGVVASGLQQGLASKQNISPADGQLILDSMGRHLRAADMLAHIRATLLNELTARDIQTLLQWYQSDDARIITAAEEAASTAEAYQAMTANAQAIMADTERVDLAKRMDKLLGSTEWGMEFQESVAVAIFSAVSTAVAPEQALQIEAYKSQMAQYRPQIRQSIEGGVLLSTVYTYRDIDSALLAKYETFMLDPAARKFHKVAMRSMGEGFEQGLTDWMVDLSKTLNNKAASAQ